MKIGEFAERNRVTAKMLRHYDEIGLLVPSEKDPETGYRSYSLEQAHLLNWILVLKSVDFSLVQIKDLLSGPIDRTQFIDQLVRKRIEIAAALNEQIQKKIAIDRLIAMIGKHLRHATIGRAAGDEFIVFARASKDLASQAAQDIIEDMKQFDFAGIGCPKQMGCYIGGVVGPTDIVVDLRTFIEDSIEALEHARKLGPNSYAIESFGV